MQNAEVSAKPSDLGDAFALNAPETSYERLLNAPWLACVTEYTMTVSQFRVQKWFNRAGTTPLLLEQICHMSLLMGSSS